MAELTDINSVILSTSTTAPYLDKALTILGLHVEARTSFITYVTTASISVTVPKLASDIGFHPC